MPKPVSVLISDVHYSVHTLQLADKAMRLAIDKANELKVPLIIAGDLHDSKANLRGECITALLKTWSLRKVITYIIIGNHDRLNEKSKEHALMFMDGHTQLVSEPLDRTKWLGVYLIPYHHDANELRQYLKTIPKGSTLIMHQGILGSAAGHYMQDKSALSKEDVAGFRVISGHYHTRQTIELPDGGKWDYIGNPYTLNFGEVNDPPKGFQILMDDGSLEFVPTDLRKHVVIEYDIITDESKWSSGPIYAGGGRNDLVWAKIKGPKEELVVFDKHKWCKDKGIPTNIKIDLVPIDKEMTLIQQNVENLSQPELFDSLIDSLSDTADLKKAQLKSMWKDFSE